MLVYDNTFRPPVKGPSRLSSREYLYCPVTFEPKRHLPPAQQNLRDCLIYLCHTIIMARVRDPRYGNGHRDGSVPLRNRYMRNIIGHRRWQSVKLLAVERELVKCDGSYSAGGRSMGYQLAHPHAEATWELREIHDEKLIRGLREWRKRRDREQWRRIRSGRTGVPPAVCEHLRRNLERIRIDQEIPEPLTPEMAVAVDLIRRGQFFFCPDGHGRIHTNATNLKRSLRGYLSADGQRLVNLDIASSQPLFIGLLLAGDRAGTTYNVHLKKERRRGEGAPSLPLCGARTPHWEGKSCGRADLADYLNLCERGELYRHIESESGLGLNRDALKQHVFAVLFGRNGQTSAVSRVFDRDFPSVMSFVQSLKAQDHRRLAHLAQRAESGFIYGRVVSRLLRERPELFIATIHDSVMTTVGSKEYVRDVMLAEFRELGISPTVRTEKDCGGDGQPRCGDKKGPGGPCGKHPGRM